MIRLLAGVGCAACVIGALGGWTARGWLADAHDAKIEAVAVKQTQAIQTKQSAQAQTFEVFRADNTQHAVETRTRIEKVYQNVPVPGDCAVPADGVSLLEAARARANSAAAGELGQPVPSGGAAAGAADRPGAAGVGG